MKSLVRMAQEWLKDYFSFIVSVGALKQVIESKNIHIDQKQLQKTILLGCFTSCSQY